MQCADPQPDGCSIERNNRINNYLNGGQWAGLGRKAILNLKGQNSEGIRFIKPFEALAAISQKNARCRMSSLSAVKLRYGEQKGRGGSFSQIPQV